MTGFLLTTLVVGPVLGAALMAGAFTVLVRPALPLPAWSLDVITIVIGAAGLLAGGIIAARQPVVAASAAPARERWFLAGAYGVNAAVVVVALVLAGIPPASWQGLAAIAAGAALTVGPSLRRRRS